MNRIHEVFGIDWCDFKQVKKLTSRFGSGLSVIKSPHRTNFNIIRTSIETKDMECEVLYRTRKGKRNGKR